MIDQSLAQRLLGYVFCGQTFPPFMPFVIEATDSQGLTITPIPITFETSGNGVANANNIAIPYDNGFKDVQTITVRNQNFTAFHTNINITESPAGQYGPGTIVFEFGTSE